MNETDGTPWSVRMVESVMHRHPLLSRRWHYEPGVALTGIEHVWQQSKEPRYLAYIKHNIDEYIGPDGEIRTYRLEDYNLDQINEGKLLFLLHRETGDERYTQAAGLLRRQLRQQPRTRDGGFWHKQVYPWQMWLDGVYMACPFLAQFAAAGAEPAAFDDVARQITLIDRHTRDARTGLRYHGWDESKSQAWANPQTGCSPSFWGRAMGWYAMALPDVLHHFPADHPDRQLIVSIFHDVAAALARVQDKASGVWYQVLDRGDRPGNYLEASASCMFVYALARGVRQGHLGPEFLDVARKGYRGILEQFVRVDELGWVHLHAICSVGGLGGKPYRDGSFEYYVREKVITDDLKGLGAFVLASVEIEAARQELAAASHSERLL